MGGGGGGLCNLFSFPLELNVKFGDYDRLILKGIMKCKKDVAIFFG